MCATAYEHQCRPLTDESPSIWRCCAFCVNQIRREDAFWAVAGGAFERGTNARSTRTAAATTKSGGSIAVTSPDTL